MSSPSHTRRRISALPLRQNLLSRMVRAQYTITSLTEVPCLQCLYYLLRLPKTHCLSELKPSFTLHSPSLQHRCPRSARTHNVSTEIRVFHPTLPCLALRLAHSARPCLGVFVRIHARTAATTTWIMWHVGGHARAHMRKEAQIQHSITLHS
jgi:hypothetical protein